MKFLAMHITNQKLSFDIFMVGNVQNIFMQHDLNTNDFWHTIKIYNFDPYNVFLAIGTSTFCAPGSQILNYCNTKLFKNALVIYYSDLH